MRWFVATGLAALSRKKVTLDKQVQINHGAPGTGKTRLGVILVAILAGLMFAKVSWLYWRDKKKAATWCDAENKVQIADYAEVCESYDYYTTPQYIDGKWVFPFQSLYSNIGIEKNGLWSSEFTIEHAMQLERQFSYTIAFISEIGAMYNLEYSTDKQLPMEDGERFTRQYYETAKVGDEQDATNIAKGLRRVTSDVWQLQECKQILQPPIMKWVFERMKKYFAKKQSFHFMAGFMICFERLINSIGFIRFRYAMAGCGTEHVGKSRRSSFIAPMTHGVNYDTRAYRMMADCRNRPAVGKLHTCLHIKNTPTNRQSCLRAEYENRPDIFRTGMSEEKLNDIEDKWWSRQFLKMKLSRLRLENPKLYHEFIAQYGDKIPINFKFSDADAETKVKAEDKYWKNIIEVNKIAAENKKRREKAEKTYKQFLTLYRFDDDKKP